MSVTFKSQLEEFLKVHDAKRTDYASHEDPFGNFREAERFGLSALDGVLTRMGDKWARLANLYRRHGKHEVKGEAIDDTLLDLINYAIIARAMWLNGERSALEPRENATGLPSPGTLVEVPTSGCSTTQTAGESKYERKTHHLAVRLVAVPLHGVPTPGDCQEGAFVDF